MIFKPAGEMCPHLKFPPTQNEQRTDRGKCIADDPSCSIPNSPTEGRLAVCTIHHLPCYRDSPCDRFDQISPVDAVCVMSGYFRSLDGSRQP